jgi:hypothetical protein
MLLAPSNFINHHIILQHITIFVKLNITEYRLIKIHAFISEDTHECFNNRCIRL